jgi:hypothetical protein
MLLFVCAFFVDLTERVEQADESNPLLLFQAFHQVLTELHHRRVELLEQRGALRCDPTEMLATVLRTSLALDEAFCFESIQQPRDPWRLFNHPIGNVEGRYAVGSATAEDAQHVVLLQRDAVWFDERGHLTPHQIRGPHQSEERFLRDALEGLSLLQLLL